MTLPTLIANYQKQETISKLQKAYTVLNQAFKLSEADNGEFEYWGEDYFYNSDFGPAFEKYWKPYLKSAKMCNISDDCPYEWNISQRGYYTSLNGHTVSGIMDFVDYTKTFYTTDGMVLAISAISGGTVHEDGTADPIIYSQNIWIDINGSNRPNQYGKDFFRFTLSKKGVMAYGYDLSDDVVNRDCSKTGSGSRCLSKIIRDGWQIKDDYPW